MDVTALVEQLGVTAVISITLIMVIKQYFKADTKIDRLFDRFDSLKDEIRNALNGLENEILKSKKER
jgi:hypothetical protein